MPGRGNLSLEAYCKLVDAAAKVAAAAVQDEKLSDLTPKLAANVFIAILDAAIEKA